MIHYNKAIRLNPQLADAWMGMGVILDQQNRLSEGIHYVKKALELEVNNAQFWYIFGEMEHKRGFFEEAAGAYRKVIELEPENADIWLDFSRLQFEQENVKGAVETLAEGIKYHPSSAEMNYRMSGYLLSLGKKQDAMGFLQQGLQLDYAKHTELFEFLPQLRDNAGIMQFIETYRAV